MEVERRVKEITAKDAAERLEMLCSKREICISQAEEKLRKWGLAPEAWDSIVNTLVNNRYIDNRRFAIAFARDKFRFNKWGPQKIRMQLLAKHIDAEYIVEALLEVNPNELPVSIIKELERKATSVKAKSAYELRMKLIAIGVRKGFSYDLVARAVSQILG